MLVKRDSRLSKTELEEWLWRAKADFDTMGTLLTPDLKEDFMKGCRRAVARLLNEGILEKDLKGAGMHFTIPRKQRLHALYYKNSIIHALLLPGIWSLAGKKLEDSLDLRTLLQFEFFFPEKEKYMYQLKSTPDHVMSGLYGHFLDDILETLAIGIQGLLAMENLWLDSKEWGSRLLDTGKRMARYDSQLRLEAVNTQGFSAFIELAKNKGWMRKSPAQDTLFGANLKDDLKAVLQRIEQYRSRLKPLETLRGDYGIAATPAQAQLLRGSTLLSDPINQK